MAKTVILMMDSFGIGGAKDAAAFGDAGANTFLHIAQNYPEFGGNGLALPNLEALGLANAGELASGVRAPLVSGLAKMTLAGRCKYGCMEEISAGKDTISGHWEMAGVPVRQDFGHFPLEYPSFPAEMAARICERAGIPGILGNKAASGTVIIQELGEEHLASGKPIFYTSADSNLQIAAHEEKFGLERLYKLCEIAFEEVKPYRIARVIARPFAGEKNGAFVRTKTGTTMRSIRRHRRFWTRRKRRGCRLRQSARFPTSTPGRALRARFWRAGWKNCGTRRLKKCRI